FSTAPTLGLARAKQALQASGLNTLEEQLALEAGMMRELGYTEDYREGVTAFMEKRSPAFKGK
ncbi:MAG: 2-(1,2-epoxy-1,2-dihydrophenyl)acetyl-CoA isomerase, partial [Oxalobacteraceae bacterium]